MTSTQHDAFDEQTAPEAETLRERKKHQTRQAIHDAALKLVEQNGLDGTTVEQICNEADVSLRTFFNYFPSKAAAALGLPEEAIFPDTIERFRAANGDLIPALCDLIGVSAGHGADRKRMKALMMKRPELMPAFTQWMSSVRDQFVQLAAERSGSHETAVAAATLVMSALGFAMHDRPNSDKPVAERVQDAVDALVAVRSAPLLPVAAEAADAGEDEPGAREPGAREPDARETASASRNRH